MYKEIVLFGVLTCSSCQIYQDKTALIFLGHFVACQAGALRSVS